MKKKIRLLTYIIFSIFILLFFIFSDFGLLKRIELNSEKNKLLIIKQKETFTRDSLLSEKKRLESDFQEIERIAREYYGYIAPGETVYIFSKTK